MRAIVVVPTQGFGNRLRMIASSYILAQYMKLDHYVIWKPADDCNLEFDSIWESSPFVTIDPEKVLKSQYINFGYVHTHSIMDKLLNPGNVKYLVLTGGHEFKHPAMNDDLFLHYKYKLYSQLIFKCDHSIKSLDLPQEYACVHYRDLVHGDMKDVEKSQSCNFIDNSPIKEFLKLLKLIDDSIHIIVISNNQLIEKSMVQHYPNKKITIIPKETSNRNTHSGMENALIDFRILSKARFIIGSYYSSFSDEATFFNIIPKIIPLSKNITTTTYHCTNFSIHDGIGYLNYDRNFHIKYLIN